MQVNDRDDRHAASRPHYVNLVPLAWPARRLTAEVKEDGYWVEVVISGRTAHVWNRHGILTEIIPLADPVVGTSVLYGEQLKGTQRSKRDPRHGNIILFDCVEYFGDDVRELPQHSRRAKAQDLVELLKHPRFDLVRSFASWSDAWDCVLAEDLEGLVLKDPMGAWGDPWFRMKQVFDVDFVCMGYVRDRHGVITSIRARAMVGDVLEVACEVPVYGRVRKAVNEAPDMHVGLVFKARGNDVTDSGALRSPRFLEWHADKTAEDSED